MVLLGPKLCFENEFITFGLFLFTEEYIELLEKTFIIRLLKEIGRQKSLRQFINHLYCVCVFFFHIQLFGQSPGFCGMVPSWQNIRSSTAPIHLRYFKKTEMPF